MRTFCYGCMSMKEQSPVCEHCGYDETQDNLPHQLPCGTVLAGQYVIGRVLGQGGFGITYLGWDRSRGAPVAVKEYYPNGSVSRDSAVSLSVFLSDTSREESYHRSRLRFLREAQTLDMLQGVPQIVRVLNYFEANNTAYIAMEYVRGMTLKNYVKMRGGRLGVAETLQMLQPIMAALSHVHNAGMIHRDISPDNIMLLPQGGAKLLDFGAVREVTDADVNKELTKSTESILKHGFAPIEQYQKRGSLGPWTDAYALCATAYYCLTGNAPPDAPARIVEGTEPDWDSIPGLTVRQREVLRKGMSIRAQDRYYYMADLWRALFSTSEWTEPAASETAAGSVESGIRNGAADIGENSAVSAGENSAAGAGGNPPEYRTVPVQTDSRVETEVVSGIPEQTVAAVSGAPKQKKPWVKIAALAAVCAAVIGIAGFALAGNDAKDDPRDDRIDTVQTPGEETGRQGGSAGSGDAAVGEGVPDGTESYTYEPADRSRWENNVLMSDAPEGYSAEDVGAGTVLGSGFIRERVISVTFLDSLDGAPSTKWDVSAKQNGRVFAWVKKNGEFYDLYIAADGGVNASHACEKLFMGYLNLEQIHFNGCFHMDDAESVAYMFGFCKSLTELDLREFRTKNLVNMRNMLNGCESLQEVNLSSFDTRTVKRMDNLFYNCAQLRNVDLSSFDTAGVVNMSGMFYGCDSLAELDVTHFDTSCVTDMSFMFSGCKNLKTLDLHNFDTSNVENMQSMFQSCYMLREVDVSSFDTSNVTRMGWMFNWCKALRRLDLRHFDTSKVVSVQGMFYGCGELEELNISGWDLSGVEKYDTFMDKDRTVNGQPWEKLFR